jgi:hypothetical protein
MDFHSNKERTARLKALVQRPVCRPQSGCNSHVTLWRWRSAPREAQASAVFNSPDPDNVPSNAQHRSMPSAPASTGRNSTSQGCASLLALRVPRGVINEGCPAERSEENKRRGRHQDSREVQCITMLTWPFAASLVAKVSACRHSIYQQHLVSHTTR